ncbi:hypothetical protein J7K86_00460 [bacterium]|nr:hypothetical protein [bacterium]
MAKKSIKKRIKITKKKKILHHPCGRDHFNAKEPGKKRRNKRRKKQFSKAYRKTLLQHIK